LIGPPLLFLALECLDGNPTSRATSDLTSTGATGPSPPGDPGADASSARRVRLHGWRHPAILAVGAATVAAGFAQFGATTALGDVAHAFGATGEGTSTVARVGLSGTTLGIGLAIVRLASLASLPLAALADRHGRRRMLLGCVSGGLAVTALAWSWPPRRPRPATGPRRSP
jgi:hypothetical protein